MKKKVLLVPALLLSMLTYAQDQKSDGSHCNACACDDVVLNKKGHPILPKQGDIALGFNAIPALDFVFNSLRYVSIMGNSAGAAANVASPTNQYVQASNNQIVGKYYLQDKLAIRARFGINTISGSYTNRVQDAEAMAIAVQGGSQADINAASLIRVEDNLKFNKSNIMVAGGLEWRRGYRRLQGYYGAEIGVGGTSERQNVTYGNAFSNTHDVYFTNDFNTFAVTQYDPATVPANNRVTRNLSSKQRGGIILGARGFIGIEYFVFAKISIAAEYGWGYAYTTRRGQKLTNEVYEIGPNGPTVFTEEVNQDSNTKTKGFSVDNRNGSIFSMNSTVSGGTNLGGGSGALTLLFHF